MEMRGMMGGFYRISEWIMRLSVTNLLWVITSLPFWYLFFFGVIVPLSNTEPKMDEVFSGLLVSTVAVPFVLFPATSAMFTTVRKWVMGDVDVPLFKTFFRGYKENYKVSMLGGIIYSLIFLIIFLDIRFYLNGASGIELISYVFMGIALLLVVSLFNFFSMVVHYHMKTLQLLKNAVLLTIGRPFRSLSSAIAAAGIAWISTRFTFLLPFFSAVVIAYLAFFQFLPHLSEAEGAAGAAGTGSAGGSGRSGNEELMPSVYFCPGRGYNTDTSCGVRYGLHRCFEPMAVSRETYIGARLTCPRKGTSKTLLRSPTCESGFRNKQAGRHWRVFRRS